MCYCGLENSQSQPNIRTDGKLWLGVATRWPCKFQPKSQNAVPPLRYLLRNGSMQAIRSDAEGAIASLNLETKNAERIWGIGPLSNTALSPLTHYAILTLHRNDWAELASLKRVSNTSAKLTFPCSRLQHCQLPHRSLPCRSPRRVSVRGVRTPVDSAWKSPPR
jgi:hypothetical protein